MGAQRDEVFLRVAQELGYLTSEQVVQCREAYELVIRAGAKHSLARLLEDRGLLTREQIRKVRVQMHEEGVHPFVGHYEILAKLGTGGMGTVYKATDREAGITVALKVLPRELVRDRQVVDRFLRGGRLAAEIKHPNVVHVYEVGQSGPDYFIAMEFVDGPTVARKVKSEQQVSEQEALDITKQVAAGLAAAHAKGIVHRDIKPSNIMITESGVAKLTDLGIARVVDRADMDITRTGHYVGTPKYMSPEQCISSKDVDVRSDIYSLGATLFHMLTGRPPFEGDSIFEVMKQQAGSRLPNPRQYNRQISNMTHDLIWRMMAKTPAGRPQTAQEVIDIIERIERFRRGGTAEDERVVQAVHEETVEPAPRRRDARGVRRRVLNAAGVLLVVVLFAIAGWMWMQRLREAIPPAAETSVRESVPERPPRLPPRPRRPPRASDIKPTVPPPRKAPKKAPVPRPPETPKKAAESKLPKGWTQVTRGVKVATPQGEQWKQITYYRNTIGMEFVLIPAGEFMMGSPASEGGRDRNEGPQHRVRITKPFYMGAFEVTQSQYQSVMSSNPSRFKGSKNPVERVSWNDAVEFCKRLSQREGVTYRLPTEAEWEYACRAGTTTPFYFGHTISTDQANYNGNYTYGNGGKGVYRNKTMSVGSFAPNTLGLYDMHGNVSEWCADCYARDYYLRSPLRDTQGPGTAKSRVLRGGSCRHGPAACRSAARHPFDPSATHVNKGLRVVCALAGAGTALSEECFRWTNVAYQQKPPIDCSQNDMKLSVKPFDLKKSFGVSCEFKVVRPPKDYELFIGCGDTRDGFDPYFFMLRPGCIEFGMDPVIQGEFQRVSVPFEIRETTFLNRWNSVLGFCDSKRKQVGLLFNGRLKQLKAWPHSPTMDRPMPTYASSVSGHAPFQGLVRNIKIGNVEITYPE